MLRGIPYEPIHQACSIFTQPRLLRLRFPLVILQADDLLHVLGAHRLQDLLQQEHVHALSGFLGYAIAHRLHRRQHVTEGSRHGLAGQLQIVLYEAVGGHVGVVVLEMGTVVLLLEL